MKNKLKRSLLMMFVIALAIPLKAQDMHFTQYFYNPLSLNPAFTGSAGCSRIASTFRCGPDFATWGGAMHAGISYDQYVHPLRSGLGFNFSFEKLDLNTSNYQSNAYYSYTIKIKKNFIIRPAVNIGFGARHLNLTGIEWEDIRTLYDDNVFAPISYPEKLTKYYFNIGSGFVISLNNSVFGFAMDHLNRPDIGFWSKSKMRVKYNAHWSYQIDIGKIASVTPSIIYMRHYPFEQLMINVLGQLGYIKTGMGNRFDLMNGNFNCLTGMLGFQNKWMSIGYSFDFSFDNPFGGSNNLHELSMAYKFNCKNKTDKFHIPLINGF
jgi:type IX secretion system PorP/SprF family membrane protein